MVGTVIAKVSGASGGATLAVEGGTSSTTYELTKTDGAAGEFLKTDGSGALSFASAAGGFHQMVVRSVTGSATYSPAAGVTKLIVAVQGAGGGGGGGHSTGYGSGGCAGGYALKFFTGVASTDVMTVVVGLGGNGYAGGGNGTAGGASQFLSVSGGLHPFTVEGGGGGEGKYNADPASGGVASGGDINIDGMRGSDNNGGNYLGAPSMLGFAGARIGTDTGAAKASTGYGAGGTGAYAVVNGVGEPGRNGVVIIWEYK